MGMVRIKTAYLSGAGLRWALAQAAGIKIRYWPWRPAGHSPAFSVGEHYGIFWREYAPGGDGRSYGWSPDHYPEHVFPLATMFQVGISYPDGNVHACCTFGGRSGATFVANRKTPYQAICRAIVDRISGDEVLVPAELLEVAS